MQLLEEGYLLRIFIGEADKYQGKPLYEWMVVQAKQQGLAGATVLRGIMGFGANSRKIQTFKLTRLSADMPVVIEIVDTKDRLEAYLETIEASIQAGMVTLEKATVRLYRGSGKS
jgi:PII-like signaling protein